MSTKRLMTVSQWWLSIVLVVLLAAGTADAADKDEVRVAKEMYAAFSSGDMDKVISLFSPDVVLIFHGPTETLPHAGTWKGVPGIQRFFGQIGEHLDIVEIGQRQFSTEGNVVSVLGWEKGVSRATGGEYFANWVHVITVESGQIVHFEEVTDSGAIADAMAPADVLRGKAYYTTCLGCHGLEGEGNASMHAPGLTLLNSDYLIRQIRHFKSSVRGGPQDFYGWQMNGRATALSGDRAVRDVVAYIDTLPDKVSANEHDGDAAKGAKIYRRSCASCHGDRAEGNVALNSPRLQGMEGWYQLEQLVKFKNGLRGAHSDDPIGQTMTASMATLQDEQSINDVIAHIVSLEE